MAAAATNKPSVINPTEPTTSTVNAFSLFSRKARSIAYSFVEDTAKVQRITRGLDVLHRLANHLLPEFMDTAQFYKVNKPYKMNE